jgi:superfamily II DNA or RNA helicase
MDELFQTIRESCSARTWSRGVELARGGGVVLLRRDDREAQLRVSVPGQATSPTVTLLLDEEDWICDCSATEDPCSHVAGAAIALKRGSTVSASSAPASGPLTARVGYRFERANGTLALRRILVRGQEESALSSSLVRLATSDRPGERVAASKADLSVELALGQRLAGGQLPAPTMRTLLAALDDDADVQLDGVPIAVGPPCSALSCELIDDSPGFLLRAVASEPERGEHFTNGAVLVDAKLHPALEPDLPAEELRLLREGRHFPPEAAGHLAMELLPRLQRRLPVTVRTQRLPQARTEAPRLSVEVARIDDRLRVLPTLVYGSPPRARLDGQQMTLIGPAEAPVPLRDEQAEQRLSERLRQRFDLRLGRAELLEPEAGIALVERLEAAREVELHGATQHGFFRAPPLEPRFEITDDDCSLSFCSGAKESPDDRMQTVPATAVLEAWQQNRSLVGLPGGGFAPLPIDWLERYGSRIRALLELRTADGALAPAARPELAQLCEDLETPAPPRLRRLRELLNDASQLPTSEPPNDLTVELRPYQREGVSWLGFMREAELGALLADDMGLGKTLQTICLMQPGQRTLVVAPTSVLGNWQNEIARFRPKLRTSLYHGARRQLDETADVVLTSYALLRLDIDRLAAEPWTMTVLDEAQLIRNPESQVAQAAFRLSSGWRVALSGTPVENRLDDLWSQFHFLNPGLLGGRSDFSERYARPIAEGRNDVAAELRQRTRPFMLRRLKQQVERQLPPRIEVVLRCELSSSERELYDAIRAATRDHVLKQLEVQHNVLAALAALLRLRQAACHSALVPGQQASSSAKLQLLLDQLDQTTAEQHKALVFSQWTSLLDLIEPALNERKLDFLRLDGSTRDRQQVVEHFQRQDGPPILLISLKAGGVGLNLTAADHIFLIDPWWNPATEDQAADRAHRIGQTKPVIVHKLVAQDTVEERILQLQAHKRALAGAALDGAEQAASLNRDELLQLLS